jgi:hypothetical protein
MSLAVGDHLHFVSVTPVELWDGKWIRDRVNKPLKEAGPPEIAGSARCRTRRRPPPRAPPTAGGARTVRISVRLWSFRP